MTLNLAPMVDVMMCLIIFFMLASKMVERENSVVALPSAAAAREADRRALGRRVVVNVLADAAAAAPADAGRGPAGAPEFARYVLDERPVTLPDIAGRLAAEHARDPGVRCVIRGDRDLPYHAVEAVLAACAGAGVENVVFAALTDAREDR